MKLRNRINLYTVVLFIGLLIVMNFVIYYLFNKLTLDSELEQAHIETEKTVFGINESLGKVSSDVLLRSYVPIDGMIRIVFEDEKSPSPVTSPAEKELTKLQVNFFENEQREQIESNGKSYAFVSIPIIWNDGQVANLQITKSIERVIENLNVLRLVLVVVTLIAMIPVVLSSRVLSQIITTPITSMIETMKEIRTSGRFKRIQLEGKRKDELEEMGDTFNHMIDILESNSKKQEQFVSNASHELKTPLTVIESYASLLKRRGKDEPKLFDESVDAIHSEAIRMREMTEQLLLLAKPNEKWSVKLESTNIKELVQQSVVSFEKGYKRKISTHVDKEVVVETDPQILRQLLYIFLDNARKYSEEDIAVTIGEQDSSAFIKISDKGIGIPQEDLSKVFDRFYRVDKARTRKHGGTGLGLALAKELADAIGVIVQLDSLEGAGTTVTIIF